MTSIVFRSSAPVIQCSHLVNSHQFPKLGIVVGIAFDHFNEVTSTSEWRIGDCELDGLLIKSLASYKGPQAAPPTSAPHP
jgi:hypothetical protein